MPLPFSLPLFLKGVLFNPYSSIRLNMHRYQRLICVFKIPPDSAILLLSATLGDLPAPHVWGTWAESAARLLRARTQAARGRRLLAEELWEAGRHGAAGRPRPGVTGSPGGMALMVEFVLVTLQEIKEKKHESFSTFPHMEIFCELLCHSNRIIFLLLPANFIEL